MRPTPNTHCDEADVYVFPSLSEGSPLVILEASAYGRSVVSTAMDSVAELILNRQAGVFVPRRDPETLAAVVPAGIRGQAPRMRCVRGGHTVLREHSIERFVRPMIEKARELAGQEDIGS